jgi:16S rRNA (guanine527-N7)-methyltransferase
VQASLDRSAPQKLDRLVELIASDPQAATSVTDPEQVRLVHIEDSLSGLELAPLREASRIADVGAGAGFPGLVLAAALPEARVDLIESVGRKCEFIERAMAAMELANATVICDRAETVAAGVSRESYDAVTARAVGRLATLAELASPLLRDGGHLIAWKGRRDPEEEAEAERAAKRTSVHPAEIAAATYPGARNRHLHLLRKTGPTPEDLPRRPGIAKKRPFGSER